MFDPKTSITEAQNKIANLKREMVTLRNELNSTTDPAQRQRIQRELDGHERAIGIGERQISEWRQP